MLLHYYAKISLLRIGPDIIDTVNLIHILFGLTYLFCYKMQPMNLQFGQNLLNTSFLRHTIGAKVYVI